MTKKDPTRFIVDTAALLVPCTHLAVWSEVRKEFDDVDPSTVWRAMVNSGRFQRENSSGKFRAIDVPG